MSVGVDAHGVLVAVGWVMAVNCSCGDGNPIVLPHFGIPPPHGAGPRVNTKFTLFWWSSEREDAGLSEVAGLCGRKSGYLCPLVAWVHNSTKAFLS